MPVALSSATTSIFAIVEKSSASDVEARKFDSISPNDADSDYRLVIVVICPGNCSQIGKDYNDSVSTSTVRLNRTSATVTREHVIVLLSWSHCIERSRVRGYDNETNNAAYRYYY